MTLSEMIEVYGNEKVAIQKIDDCASTIDWSAKKGTSLKIHTMEPAGFDGMERFGLVLWFDRGPLQKILDENKGK